MTEQWVSCADLSRRVGVSRPAVQKALDSGRIPASATKRVGSRRLVRLDAGLAVLGHHAPAAAATTRPTTPAAAAPSLFAWGSSAAPAPAAKPEPDPQPEPEPAQDDAAALARWAGAYGELRRWLLWGASSGYSGAMWAALGDGPLQIGDVMVAATELIAAQLVDLDRLATEHACRMQPNEWRSWH